MSNPLNHIAIIDYGMGNLHSVSKALQHVGENIKISITVDPTVINSADRVVFPGVGAIGDCMSEILRLDIGNILKKLYSSQASAGYLYWYAGFTRA